MLLNTKLASIIDYPRKGLDKSIWKIDGENLELQSNIKDEINDIIGSFLDDLDIPESAIIDVFIYGSILTNQYNSKTDVDARILLDPNAIKEQYPGMTGDDLYDLAIDTVHGVLLGDTQHPFNATIVIEGEETELGQSPLGISERDPVYSIKEEKVIHEGIGYDESFDPDIEFMEERSDVAEIMTKLDKLVQDAKTNTIDIEMLKEAIGEVSNPDTLIKKIEDKLNDLNFTIEKMVNEYNQIKEERSRSYKKGPKEDRHKAPGNIRFKFLEKYRYMDMLKKLKKLFKNGIDPSELDDVAKTLNVKAYPYRQPGLPDKVEAPPTMIKGPEGPTEVNKTRIEDGGMMHGANCPHCGYTNPVMANKSKEIKCVNCGNKFAGDLSVNTAPSTQQYTLPYESDLKLYAQSMSPQILEDMTTLLKDIGVSPQILEEFKKKIKGEPIEETETRPENAETPQGPETMNTTVPVSTTTQSQHTLKPGIPLKQLSKQVKFSRDWEKEEFIEHAKLGEEFQRTNANEYAVILEEMSEPEKGAYRVQWYTAIAPIGHTTYSTFEGAAQSVYEALGPKISLANGSMDKFALSDNWIKALYWLTNVTDEDIGGWLSESVDDIKQGHLLFGVCIMENLLDKLNKLKADSAGVFGEPPGHNPGDDPYSSGGGALAEYGKEDKGKGKEKNKDKVDVEPDEDVILEVLTVLDGIDIIPFLNDDELLLDLLQAFPVLGRRSNLIDKIIALYPEPPEGIGQYVGPRNPDYETEPIQKKRGPLEEGRGKGRPGGLRKHKNIEECPLGGPGKGKGEGRGKGIFRKDKIEETGEAVGIDWFDKYPSKYKTAADEEIKALILDWLKENPNPEDDAVHDLAEELEMEPDDLEEIIYEIVTEHSKEDKEDINKEEKPLEKNKLTEEMAEAIGEEIGINWEDSPFDAKQFLMGIQVELEHGTKDPETDVTDDDLIATGKIAWAHLKEIDDYYYRLKKMEDDAAKATKNEKENKDSEESNKEESNKEESNEEDTEKTSEGNISGFDEGFPANKTAAAYMTVCPNCKTIQKAPIEGEGKICPLCNRGWLDSLEVSDPEKYQEYKEQEEKESEELYERRQRQRGIPHTAARLDKKIRKQINKELYDAGMDGNGRFDKATQAYSMVLDILNNYGLKPTFDIGDRLVDADILLEEFQNKGQEYIELETLEGEPIKNAQVTFSYYQFLETGKYEIIAYIA